MARRLYVSAGAQLHRPLLVSRQVPNLDVDMHVIRQERQQLVQADASRGQGAVDVNYLLQHTRQERPKRAP